RIVELEREVVATFFGAFRPGGTDLGTTHENAMARSFVVRGGGFRDDAGAFCLQAEGGDLALGIVADLLVRTDVSDVTSAVCVSSPRPPRPRWRSAGRRRSATHPKGRSAAEDAVVETFLPREEWAKPRGRKSMRWRCGSDDRGAAGLRPDRAIAEPGASRAEPQVREKMA